MLVAAYASAWASMEVGMQQLVPSEIRRMLQLDPLVPEGGHVRQTYVDDQCSAIYYLMEHPDFSGLHRLEHLEIWAHHAGAPVAMLLIDESGVAEPVLGSDLSAGQQPQIVVRSGVWQAAEPLGPWALVSTFVSPPYSDDIVSFARWADLEGRHLQHEERIRRLCRF
jgi:predicted cupin superfamily sugar epimerase